MLLRQLGEVAGDDVPAGIKLKANSGEEASQPVVGPDLDGEGHVRLFLEFDLQISAQADGGPRFRVCARETLRSAPHRRERKCFRAESL